MDSALASLLGALVGGAASLGATAYTERSQRKRESRREATEASNRAVVAARLVQGDLAWAEARVRQALANDKYWSSRYQLNTASWEQYREDLAVALDNVDDWIQVHDAFRLVHTLELQASRRRSENPLSRPPLREFGRSRAQEGIEKITAAIDVLEHVARGRIREEATEDQ